jgi:hypothetical protein
MARISISNDQVTNHRLFRDKSDAGSRHINYYGGFDTQLRNRTLGTIQSVHGGVLMVASAGSVRVQLPSSTTIATVVSATVVPSDRAHITQRELPRGSPRSRSRTVRSALQKFTSSP